MMDALKLFTMLCCLIPLEHFALSAPPENKGRNFSIASTENDEARRQPNVSLAIEQVNNANGRDWEIIFSFRTNKIDAAMRKQVRDKNFTSIIGVTGNRSRSISDLIDKINNKKIRYSLDRDQITFKSADTIFWNVQVVSLYRDDGREKAEARIDFWVVFGGKFTGTIEWDENRKTVRSLKIDTLSPKVLSCHAWLGMEVDGQYFGHFSSGWEEHGLTNWTNGANPRIPQRGVVRFPQPWSGRFGDVSWEWKMVLPAAKGENKGREN